ncbi:MAG: hypothetical protein DA408_17440 [Bacteroidetes bacterium]|nr:MAG: hypothetical protein C7N36_08175 [Bacteroidota bacterium]PTM09839.1 MAG: hypothetical protein DA408_17440 [Bacteroidota bacterium]
MTFKILCDVHIAYKVVSFFEAKGYHAVHVNTILERWYTKDSDISRYADDNEFIVLTKDADFKNSHFVNGHPARLRKISLGNISTKKLIAILEQHFGLLIEHFQAEKCFIELGVGYMEVVKR